MSNARNILFSVFLLASSALFAESCPAHYYDRIEGANDSILKGRLKAIIRNHTVIEYSDGSWEVFYYADRDENGYCMDMYCDDWKKFGSPGSAVSGCNVEHSFAKSWWGGAKNDAYKDCYHLNPSNSTANSSRSNYPPGIPVKEFKDQSKTGSLRVGKRYNDALKEDHFVFEPKDEYKGDFARAYFYMATCYGRDSLGQYDKTICSAYKGWRLDNKDVGSRYGMQNENYFEFQPWLVEVLLDWHRKDPVSKKELNRMNAVSDFQHNRNPFIEYPCLAEYIWGNRKGQKVQLDSLTKTTAVDWLSLKDSLALTGCMCDTTPLPPPEPKDTFSVLWRVDNMEYTAGSPTVRVAKGEKITALPTNPESCCATSELFMGWTDQPIFGTTDEAPTALYTKTSDFPKVEFQHIYYAVFAHDTQTGGGTGDTLSYSGSGKDWTAQNMKSASGYQVLQTSASISSPVLDGSSLQKITMTLRTYGGDSYNTASITFNGTELGQLKAASKTLTPYTLTISSAPKGTGSVVFTSPTSGKEKGVGVSNITIIKSGVKHTYSAYLTSCQQPTDLNLYPLPTTHYTKILHEGHLYILRNGVYYNLNGQPINNQQ